MIEHPIHPCGGGFSRVGFFCLLAGFLAVSGGHLSADAAGLVITREGRFVGKLVVKDGSVTVDEKKVLGWDEVVVAVNDKADARKDGENALEFKNGEVWTGLIESMKNGVVGFTSPVMGKREVAVEELRAMNFQPGLPPVAGGGKQVLHRLRGNPSPGELLTVDAKRVSAETSLGVLSFERSQIARYVFDADPAGDVGVHDVVAMTDGSILQGKATAVSGGIVIDHETGGDIRLATAAWMWICRYSPDVIHLSEVPPGSTRASPLILHAPDPPQVEQSHQLATDGRRPFVRRIHFQPRTRFTYKTAGGEFSTILSLGQGARGQAIVRFRAGEKILKDYVLKPTDTAPVEVRLPVAAPSMLDVDVDFGKEVLFPCGVVMDDPLVIAKP